MKKTPEELQAALDREIEYSQKLNEKIDRLREQIKNSVTKYEHEKIIAHIRREYDQKLSKNNNRPIGTHNERGAGRKKIATEEVVTRALELNNQGLPQAKIAAQLSDEYGIKIGRTTVGEIVRGNYSIFNEG